MKISSSIFFFVLLISLFLAPLAMAEESNDSITGILSIEKNETGEITSISLSAESYDENDTLTQTSFEIPVNETTKEMAQKCEGKEIEVFGTITESESKNELNVSSYQLVNAKESEDTIPEENLDDISSDSDDTEAIDIE